MDCSCSPPGSSVHGISQARTLGWAAIPSSRGLPHPGIGRQVLYHLSPRGRPPQPTPASGGARPSYLGLNYSRASCLLAGSGAGLLWVRSGESGGSPGSICAGIRWGLALCPRAQGHLDRVRAPGAVPVLSSPRSPGPVRGCPGRAPPRGRGGLPRPRGGRCFSICRVHDPCVSTLAHEADRGTSRETAAASPKSLHKEGEGPPQPRLSAQPCLPCVRASRARAAQKPPVPPQPALRALQV